MQRRRLIDRVYRNVQRTRSQLYLRRKPKKGKIMSAGWRKNDKDIRKLLEGKRKTANITIPKTKKRKKLPIKDEPVNHKNMFHIQMQNNSA